MAFYKTAFLIKRERQLTVTRPHTKNTKIITVCLLNKLNHPFSVAHALAFRQNSNILDFKNFAAFVSNNTFRFYAILLQNIHRTFFKIPVDHIFLLVRKKKQAHVSLFIILNFAYFHQLSSSQIGRAHV